MQAEVNKCYQREEPELERVECCFKTTADSWLRVRQQLADDYFESEQEEIDFFKNVKPLFTSQIELYTLIYQGILFSPKEDPLKIESYWVAEAARLARFRENKEAFMQYYKSGDTSLDKLYFLRNNNMLCNGVTPKIYDLNADLTTSHDWLVAALMAQEDVPRVHPGKLKELGR